MKFDSEVKRLQHPLAKLIPKNLWNLMFSEEIDPLQLSLLQTPISEFITNPQLINTKRNKASQAWICIFLANPDASTDQLIQAATLLKLSNYQLFFFASTLGSLAILQVIFSRLTATAIRELIQADNYYVFRFAASNGQLEVMLHLEKQAPELVKEMIRAKDYNAFRHAASHGQFEVMLHLEKQAPELIQDMIQAGNYYAFRFAASLGQLEMLLHLEKLAPELVQEMTQAIYYNAFRYAASHGQLEVLLHFEKQAPELVKEMIQARKYNAFSFAAGNGQLEVLLHLEKQAPELIQEMIEANNYLAFRLAASNNHLEILLHIEKLAPNLIQEMIQADNYLAFFWAAKENHHEVLQHLEEKARDIQKMIQASDFRIFSYAAEEGLIDVLLHLEKQAPELVKEMIKAQKYAAFRKAAAQGHLDVLLHLEKQAPELVQEMIQEDTYCAYREAASNGHLHVVQHLEEQAPELIGKMIQALNYNAFWGAASNGHLDMLLHFEKQAPNVILWMINRGIFAFSLAASNGHLNVLLHFEELAPNSIQQMIYANDYAAFRGAASHGHLDVLLHLEEKDPDFIQQMIEADNYEAFRQAASHRHLDVLLYLKEKAPDLIQEMINANDNEAFRNAVLYNLPELNQFLLSHYSCFAYAEQHDEEYRDTVYPFVVNKLVQLRISRQQQEEANPNIVFDLNDANEAKICAFIIRNLIRRNDRSLDEELLFLLEIPAVKALLHTELQRGHGSNELLRLAFNLGNDTAARMLLSIPAVHQLAEQSNFYRLERHAGRDLRELAQDRESSMNALTPGEQKRFDAVIKLYKPVLNKNGAFVLMKQLREQLLERYSTNPAKISVDGNEIILPKTWEEFKALKLEPAAYEQALLAYYQNKDHTAWRYMLKPNPWVAEDAQYVEKNPGNPSERYSSFEGYIPFILLMWLASQDENQPPTENHTLEGRLTHFVSELALLGRAHNWDKTRINESTGEDEEYDDLRGDDPSCYSGVKRRLFQSVIGHPLIQVLTMDNLKQELRSFVRAHIQEHINEANREQLIQAYQKYTNSTDLTDAAPLKDLDIETAKQDEFIKYLEKKYGDQFTGDDSFRRYIVTLFLAAKDTPQVFNFAGLARLEDLLKLKQEKPSSQAKPIAQGELSYQNKLQKCGTLGATIILQIKRLQEAEGSINPYWINSEKKLHAIIQAINSLPENIDEKSLAVCVKNHEEALYQALNIQRLSPLTFLGKLGWNHAKSLQAVQEVAADQTINIDP